MGGPKSLSQPTNLGGKKLERSIKLNKGFVFVCSFAFKPINKVL